MQQLSSRFGQDQPCKIYATLQLESRVSPGSSGKGPQEKLKADHEDFGAGFTEDQKPTILQLKRQY